MRDLIHTMWDRFGQEAPAVADLARAHCNDFLARGLIPAEHLYTTSIEDCVFLYLLIRYFNRRSAFEVGAYIGTSALCMNEGARRNGGVMTTTDPVDYGGIPPWSGIRFIRGPAIVGLSTLKDERKAIDFCFFDWLPDDSTLHLLQNLLAPDAILATHDYGNNVKGEQTIEAINRVGLLNGRKWLLPSVEQPVLMDGMRINYCTAVCIPTSLIEPAEAAA
jgi:predicted O-methyltransferase YrrM